MRGPGPLGPLRAKGMASPCCWDAYESVSWWGLRKRDPGTTAEAHLAWCCERERLQVSLVRSEAVQQSAAVTIRLLLPRGLENLSVLSGSFGFVGFDPV